ncbi:Hpt domain-containing protein [Alteromonas sp. ZYF713]|nr:Hpt domain-containing protein [Alteromonas sp. ZYF713]
MQEQPMVIDFDFGLRQLNGNRSLLYRLLRKFAAEYQSLDTRLQTMLAQQEITEAENLVHTLKGVSGNLGCTAVYQSSRLVNEELKLGKPEQSSLKELIHRLAETIRVIEELPDDSELNSSAKAAPSDEKQQTYQALSQALQHHEYINDEKLNNWLTTLELNSSHQQELVDAVSSLEYDKALAILEDANA